MRRLLISLIIILILSSCNTLIESRPDGSFLYETNRPHQFGGVDLQIVRVDDVGTTVTMRTDKSGLYGSIGVVAGYLLKGGM